METIRIEILDSKAKSLLKNFADLNLIRIQKGKSEFMDLLEKLRKKSEKAPNLEEITKEIETVRKAKHEK